VVGGITRCNSANCLTMGVLMSRAAAASSATVIVCVMSALRVADRTAFAQAGSTGGTIGKTNLLTKPIDFGTIRSEIDSRV
jgi:hypothetical protein